MSVNVEHITFGVLMAANLGLGLYFAFSRRARKAPTADEVFLGSRTMGTLPLAMSVLASMISAIGVIGFGAHYYAHGFHYAWSLVSAPLLVPVVTLVVIPVLYKLRVTSVFEQQAAIFVARAPGWTRLACATRTRQDSRKKKTVGRQF
ncbi:hypothetical protein HPB49_003121 [Dermacentor silvarum]|uniref:Uncharacterized protein n=1 Tax=Dermacentor silvarum TaxID=543639 RepID=A0ACB8DTD1_DERSI|nr:hypothetical protein HPB49_003121 [Dermacentor silvarum]